MNIWRLKSVFWMTGKQKYYDYWPASYTRSMNDTCTACYLLFFPTYVAVSVCGFQTTWWQFQITYKTLHKFSKFYCFSSQDDFPHPQNCSLHSDYFSSLTEISSTGWKCLCVCVYRVVKELWSELSSDWKTCERWENGSEQRNRRQKKSEVNWTEYSIVRSAAMSKQ